MAIDTEDKELIRDSEENPRIGRLISLHTQVNERNPHLGELIEILIEDCRAECAARRAPTASEAPAPTPEPKKRPG